MVMPNKFYIISDNLQNLYKIKIIGIVKKSLSHKIKKSFEYENKKIMICENLYIFHKFINLKMKYEIINKKIIFINQKVFSI